MPRTYKIPKPKQLLESGVHFGHQTRRWNPKMEPFIFSQRQGIHVIDLEKTESLLKEACDFLYDIAKEGGQIIFVGTKRQAAEIIKLEAKRCGALFVNSRWLGGTITNHRVISKNMENLVELIRKREQGELDHYTKKERLLIDRNIDKLQGLVGGLVGLKGKPRAVFMVDVRRERTAVREAKKSGIPVVGLIDTNSNPAGIDYAIPGNDDAIKSIATVVKVVADAVESGYKDIEKKEVKEVVEESEEIKPVKKPAPKKAVKTAIKKVIKKKVVEEPKKKRGRPKKSAEA